LATNRQEVHVAYPGNDSDAYHRGRAAENAVGSSSVAVAANSSGGHVREENMKIGRFRITWLLLLNVLVLQWLFVRLARVIDVSTNKHVGWKLARWIVPMTGWGWTEPVYLLQRFPFRMAAKQEEDAFYGPRDMTWLEATNMFLIQWFFIRLGRMLDEDGIQEGWCLILFPIPMTGWKNDRMRPAFGSLTFVGLKCGRLA
jgi:hypothetical protein